MSASKIKFILLLAGVMLMAKPFVGFSLRYRHYFKAVHPNEPSILVKAFTKRKLETSENSEFSMASITKKLNNPVFPVILVLAFALNEFLPRFFKSTRNATRSFLADLLYSLYSPQPLYLLSGKLTI